MNILHEPFSYLYYVHKDASAIDQQYVDPDHPTDYKGIRTHIEKEAADKDVFSRTCAPTDMNTLKMMTIF